MAAPTVESNGHQPAAERVHTPPPPQPPTTVRVDKEDKVQVLVDKSTRRMVADAARRLGRTHDQVVAAGVALLNQRTKDQKAKTKDEWLAELTGGQP